MLDVLAVRDSLQTVDDELSAVLDDPGRADAVASAAGRASDAATDAQERTDGAVWSVAAAVPWLSEQIGAVDALVDVADAATGLAVAGVDAAGPLLTGELPLPVADGAVDLVALDELLAPIDELPVEPLEGSLRALDEIEPDPLVADLADARQRVLGVGDRALGAVATAQDIRRVVPGLLGGDGGRTYFLALQNSAEVRGTGGFLGFLATLRAEDGQLSVGPVTSYEVGATLDEGDPLLARRNDFEDPSRYDDPVPRSEEMAARYDHVQVGGFLGNANVHPDLAVTAPSLLALVERNAGVELDGVIAIDPSALGLLQQAIGPLDVPDPVAALAPQLPDPIPPGRIADVLLTDAYQELGGESNVRKAYHAAVAMAATTSVLGGDWEPEPFIKQLARAVDQRHIQVFSRNEGEQAALERLGVAGRLVPVDSVGDLLAVTSNNSGGNKQDVLVGHSFAADVELSEPDVAAGTVRADRSMRVEVDNPLDPDGLDPYISGISGQGDGAAQNHAERRYTADNLTWFSVWSPVGAAFTGARDDDGEPLSLAHGPVEGVVGVDHHLLTVAGSTSSFEVDLVHRAPIVVDGDEVVYRLTLWRQAKAIPDLWDLEISAPEGWEVTDATVAGGGDGLGTGVHADGVELETGVGARAVAVRGTTTADLVVEVRLRRP